jgi:hypothetical protein
MCPMMHDTCTAFCNHCCATYWTATVPAGKCLTALIINYGVLQASLPTALCAIPPRNTVGPGRAQMDYHRRGDAVGKAVNGSADFTRCQRASPARSGARWCYRTGRSGRTGQTAFDHRQHFVERHGPAGVDLLLRSCGPLPRRTLPRVSASAAVSANGVFQPSDEAGENGHRLHRVGLALLAIACVLIRLHLAGEVASLVHADCGGHCIRENGLHQFLSAVVANPGHGIRGTTCAATVMRSDCRSNIARRRRRSR